jgi:FHA domain
MGEQNPEEQWRMILVEQRFLWAKDPIRPADLSHKLRDIMLARENLIEDANYHKVVPNRFVIEINEENFAKNYQPIQKQVIGQWREKLLEDLEMANARQGRREYNYAGRVELQIRPGPNLAPNQARIYCQVSWMSENGPPEYLLPAGVELIPAGKRWRLHRGIVTIGREPGNDITLEGVEVQERRLVSAKHAFIECDEKSYVLRDGSPAGHPSTNGTYVNSIRVGPDGARLVEGDLILLAAIRPDDPRPDTPGVAVLRFKLESGV